MSDLAAVFEFAATVIGSYLVTMLSHWYTQIILFLAVLSGIVASLIVIRGDR